MALHSDLISLFSVLSDIPDLLAAFELSTGEKRKAAITATVDTRVIKQPGGGTFQYLPTHKIYQPAKFDSQLDKAV